MADSEVVVIGGGIVGTSAAAFLAERGRTVTLVERAAIGAGASGRNFGVVQHPFDPVLAALYAETLSIYRAMAERTEGFSFPTEPAGLLVLGPDRDLLAAHLARYATMPELHADLLEPRQTRSLEPGVAPDLWSLRLATGYPIPPEAATAAMAERAAAAGARVEVGAAASPVIERGRVVGVVLEGLRRIAADLVLIAAGPWSPYLVDPTGDWRPIGATWGATARLAMEHPPRHVLEEAAIDEINRPIKESGDRPPLAADVTPSVFSAAAADGIATIGSTFLATEPDHRALAPLLVERGARFLPALRDGRITATRACARPQSVDGRPLVGALPGVSGLHLAAGHGPWGISCGPATARLAVDAMLDASTDLPAELAVARVPGPTEHPVGW